jgi:hypothetical protein
MRAVVEIVHKRSAFSSVKRYASCFLMLTRRTTHEFNIIANKIARA